MTSSEEKREYRLSGWVDMGIDEVPFGPIFLEEAMSARTAADEKAKNAPEIEAAAADVSTFYRYLASHGVDRDTARALTLQYQADQMMQAAKIREGIDKPPVATPVAETSVRKA